MKRLLAILAVVIVCLPLASVAQGLFAVARLDSERSEIVSHPDGFDLVLTLSQPIPYKVTTLADPSRLVIDFREADFGSLRGGDLGVSPAVTAVRHGLIQAGWSRMVVDLDGPYAVQSAGMETESTDGSARIEIVLRETDPTSFAAHAGPSIQAAPPAIEPAARGPDDGVLTVVIDPGHGGIDPGAVRGDVHEADLVLSFALELRDALLRAEGFDAILTRTKDEFVSLEARIDVARRANGEVLLSLHADAVSEGIARGAQIYTLSEEASSAASAKLAERHDRADLLAGVDLSGQDDEVARVLMSIARTETSPRTDALAEALLEGFRKADVRLHKRPLEQAAFSVLKAPDIPSVLIEIGFMSSPKELEKLQNPEWRAAAQGAIVDALKAWDAQDRARAAVKRQ
ncbi:N-acetylmuramoyl-L-alanine amidase [Aliiruegeria sabulilitoris]|uniref:N-acetylmuramoyl-L-alanine amidase n=1 Tax=Aliiruegeria sabulilitoris TaxID=1510458 RepID=UPI000834B7E8|nr:N-acetylmuramoyl-L-alanine amidase [Aliiruegeria sabulilitoris]NDR56444.1 N-acetylmuramoyl-L-alanine amidase [Pseudoruegeria sp. M32A2M]